MSDEQSVPAGESEVVETQESSGQVEVSADGAPQTEQELQSQVEQAIEEGASEEEVKNMIREFTLRVNGKEYVKKIDLSDEDSLRNELQLALAGRQAMQRSRELEKLYQSEVDRLKTDPASVMKELGIDPLKFAADFIERHLEQSKKSPEELEREQKLKEFEEIKKENERLKAEKEKAAMEAALSKVEAEIETDILSALDSDPDLPATPEIIAMVADNLLWAMDNKIEGITAKDVLPTVKAEIQRKLRQYSSSLKSPAAIKAMLGDEVLGKLKEERIQQASKQVKSLSSIKTTGAAPSAPAPAQKRKLSDLLR